MSTGQKESHSNYIWPYLEMIIPNNDIKTLHHMLQDYTLE